MLYELEMDTANNRQKLFKFENIFTIFQKKNSYMIGMYSFMSFRKYITSKMYV